MTQLAFGNPARLLKALAHPKRLEILSLLQNRVLTAAEVERMTGFPQANLSQHLHILKTARVIVADRSGKNIRYRLTHPNFLKAIALIKDVGQGKQSNSRVRKNGLQVQDPVCGMWIAPAAANFSTIYKGATYFFCASGCRNHFDHSPQKYV